MFGLERLRGCLGRDEIQSEAGGLGLEGGDHVGFCDRNERPGHGAAALCDDVRESPLALQEPLGVPEPVGAVPGQHFAERGLGGHDQLVEAAELVALGGLLLGRLAV